MNLKPLAVLMGPGRLAAATAAGPVVVAESACPHYAIDIEAFATCDGERGAEAADTLSLLGYRNVVRVVDGYEGDIGPDGRRSVDGWKNAGLPWTAHANTALVAKSR
jgi:hypothetical protein